jgi:hypothetical protein
MPQFRDIFDAAQSPQSAANALKLQVGVHTQAWSAVLDAIAAGFTTEVQAVIDLIIVDQAGTIVLDANDDFIYASP